MKHGFEVFERARTCDSLAVDEDVGRPRCLYIVGELEVEIDLLFDGRTFAGSSQLDALVVEAVLAAQVGQDLGAQLRALVEQCPRHLEEGGAASLLPYGFGKASGRACGGVEGQGQVLEDEA